MRDETNNTPVPESQPSQYEPPLVERVMDAEELSLEVHYASFVPIS